MTSPFVRAVWVVVLLLGMGLVPRAARAQDEALIARVEALLAAGVEPSGAHDTLAALGLPGELALIAVFERAQAARYVRLRALSMLASFPSETAARYLEALVRAAASAEAASVTARADTTTPLASASAVLAPPNVNTLGELHPSRSLLVLRRALVGLLETGPRLRPGLDVAAVTWCLSHPDAHVRSAAATLLAALPGGDARSIDQALSGQLSHERSRMVRASVQQALTSRSARPTGPR